MNYQNSGENLICILESGDGGQLIQSGPGISGTIYLFYVI